MRMISRCKYNSGFTLIEILMVLSLISIVSVVSISLVGDSVDEGRYNATMNNMQQIRTALIGNTDLQGGNVRTSYGYLGDVGALPTNAQGLSALITKPAAFASWGVNNAARIGLGWNGPYLSANSGNPLQDAWGRNILYDSTTNPPTITSYGADGVAGGTGYNQDIVLTIPTNLTASTVYGFVSNAGGPYLSTATVDLNYPNGSGGLQTTTLQVPAANKGAFQFTNIPLGSRSLTVYVPSKAAPTTTIGPILMAVDQSNYLVPANLTDVNPSGSGSGTGTGTGSGSGGGGSACPKPAGILSYVPGTGSVQGANINFSAKVTQNVTISAVSLTTNSKNNWDQLAVGGSNYSCYSRRTLNPCPAANGQQSTLSRPASTGGGRGWGGGGGGGWGGWGGGGGGDGGSSGNTQFSVGFGSSMSGEKNLQITITHSAGCDTISVTDL